MGGGELAETNNQTTGCLVRTPLYRHNGCGLILLTIKEQVSDVYAQFSMVFLHLLFFTRSSCRGRRFGFHPRLRQKDTADTGCRLDVR
jgi:hypothetical protein